MLYSSNDLLFSIIFSFLFLSIFSCSEDFGNKEAYDNGLDRIDLINNYADSGLFLYQKSHDALANGEPVELIKNKYESEVQLVYKKVDSLFDCITNDYEIRRLNQNGYDDLVGRLELVQLQEKVRQLDSLGVKFLLK